MKPLAVAALLLALLSVAACVDGPKPGTKVDRRVAVSDDPACGSYRWRRSQGRGSSWDVALDLLPNGSARLGVRHYMSGQVRGPRPETEQIGTWRRVGRFIVVDSGASDATHRPIYVGKEVDGVLCFEKEPRQVGPGEFVPGPQTGPGDGTYDGPRAAGRWAMYEMERGEAKR